jgi:hypothetical protein
LQQSENKAAKQMKLIVKFALIFLAGTTMLLAQSPRQVGAWSIYTSSATSADSNLALLQTTTGGEHQDSKGPSGAAKLDVICKNHKVMAVALETGSKIDRHLVSYGSPVPTVRLGFDFPGSIEISENWAVAAGGSLSPYSELSQSHLNQTWIKRLTANQNMVLHLDRQEEGTLTNSTFDTRELSAALRTVGCTK